MKKKLKEIYTSNAGFIGGMVMGISMSKNDTNYRQIDWDIIEQILKSKEYDAIVVGLAQDWSCTAEIIYDNNQCEMDYDDDSGYFHGSSSWATPAVKLYKKWDNQDYISPKVFECWVEGNDPDIPKHIRKLISVLKGS